MSWIFNKILDVMMNIKRWMLKNGYRKCFGCNYVKPVGTFDTTLKVKGKNVLCKGCVEKEVKLK